MIAHLHLHLSPQGRENQNGHGKQCPYASLLDSGADRNAGYELPLSPSLINKSNSIAVRDGKRGSGGFSSDGDLGVSPKSIYVPQSMGD